VAEDRDPRKGLSMFPIIVVTIVVGFGAFLTWGLQQALYKIEADDNDRSAAKAVIQGKESQAGVEADRERMANLQNVSVKPITIPTLDMSKIKIPAGPAPAVERQPNRSRPKKIPTLLRYRRSKTA
jgi:hypothetical protein